MFNKRTWSVIPVESLSELAEKLHNHSHTLCTGFRWKDFLFLNDSLSEDGLQEYAVVHVPSKRQLESLTVSWSEHVEGLEMNLRTCTETVLGHFGYVDLSCIEEGDHECELCR